MIYEDFLSFLFNIVDVCFFEVKIEVVNLHFYEFAVGIHYISSVKSSVNYSKKAIKKPSRRYDMIRMFF